MIAITLPWLSAPLTQNLLRRMHFQTEAKLKRTAIAEVITAIRRAKVKPIDGPVHVTLHYRPGTRRRFDADGLAPTLKVALDALTRSGLGHGPNVLTDDDWTRVPKVTIEIHPPTLGVPAGMWLGIEDA